MTNENDVELEWEDTRAPSNKLESITLNNCDSQFIPSDFVRTDILQRLLPHVREGSGHAYCFDFIVTRVMDGCAVFTVLFEGSTISQGTVCWKESAAEQAFDRAMESWAMVNKLYQNDQSAPLRQRPQSSAWMCVTLIELEVRRLTNQGRLKVKDLGVLGCFESCLGWAIIRAFEQ
jgi:hypothetical protein